MRDSNPIHGILPSSPSQKVPSRALVAEENASKIVTEILETENVSTEVAFAKQGGQASTVLECGARTIAVGGACVIQPLVTVFVTQDTSETIARCLFSPDQHLAESIAGSPYVTHTCFFRTA